MKSDRTRSNDDYCEDDDANVLQTEGVQKTTKHMPGETYFCMKEEKKLVHSIYLFGDPDHHQETQPNVGAPRYHLAASEPSKS